MTDYFNVLMQTQASGKSYQQYLEEQLAQCTCSLAIQQQNALMQQQTQRILSESVYNYFPVPLLSLSEIQQIIEPYKVTTEYCCDDGSSMQPKKTNCVNCGAALRGRHKCIYCDTYNE